ncbi:MAG: hypothetical protein VKO64_12620 [Candidatus Sericytochromatia bacterium]|nr:hypothetical protein [Candidatus Sericytochromatia bacterium]
MPQLEQVAGKRGLAPSAGGTAGWFVFCLRKRLQDTQRTGGLV